MKSQKVIINASKYNFHNDNSQEIKGVKVQWLGGLLNHESMKGHKVASDSLSYDEWKNIKDVPGVYEVIQEEVIDREQNTKLKMKSVKFVRPYKLTD